MQASNDLQGPSRKRLRRDTRSCYQCRSRKVKCQLTTEDVAACAACIKTGASCTLDQPSASAKAAGCEPPARKVDSKQDERLERIEGMLAKLVQLQDSRASLGLDSLATPLFDFGSFGGHFGTESSFWDEMPTMDLLSPSYLSPLEKPSLPSLGQQVGANQALAALLPCQQDANAIFANTTAWLWGLRWCPPGSIFRPNESIPDLNMVAISHGSTMDLAKALLYLALYMQQLPPDFDAQSLQTPDVETTIQCYVSTVNSLVLVQEEMVCSSDGLECLHMLGMIYINEGAFRKAWLSFRRALDVAKIKGFRNSYASSSRQGPSYKLAAQRRLWLDTIAGDCYLSLLLGLEPVLGSEPFGRNGDADDQHGNVDAKFEREFYPIVARLAKNRFLDQHDYEPAREIDRLLDELWDSMPGAWQRTPTLRLGRSFESAKDYSRLMCHLHFFLIRIFIHLPFAFSDGTGDQEYSKDRCLEASRIILHWYFGLQKDGKGQPRCKIIDITAFLAAVTILLTEAGHGAATSRKQAYSSDRALLDQFMHSQEALGLSCEREHIAKQSATVLSALLASSNKLEGTVILDTRLSEHTLLGIGTTRKRSGLEDMLLSSFRKAFDTHNKAARVFDLAFSNER